MQSPQNDTTEISQEEPLAAGRWGRRSLFSFILAIGILAFFTSRLNINFIDIWETLKGANLWLAFAGFLTYYMVFVFRALRWRIFLGNVEHESSQHKIPPLPALAEMVFLSWFVNCVMPGKLGDVYRAYQYKRATGSSLSLALGTIFAERFIDVAVLVVFLVGALVGLGKISSESQGSPTNIVGAGIVLLMVGTLGLAGMWVLRERLPSLMPQRVQAIYARFQHGILASFQNMPTVIPISFMVWLAEIGRVFFVVHAMGLGDTLSPAYIVLLSLTQALLSVVPFTPGGLGLVETGMVGLLLFAGLPKELAVATAVLDRTISYWSLVIFGFIVFVIRRKV